MKPRKPCHIAVLLSAVCIASPAVGYADQNPSGFFAWFATSPQRAQPPTAHTPFPWGLPRQAQPRAPAMPWFGHARQPYGNPYTRPVTPMNPFASYGSMPFSSGGMTAITTTPMVQGMGSIVAPMAMNYAIASMNPTTMSNFFGLMATPNAFGSMPTMPLMDWRGFGVTGTYIPPAPRAYGAAPSTVPFLFGFRPGMR